MSNSRITAPSLLRRCSRKLWQRVFGIERGRLRALLPACCEPGKRAHLDVVMQSFASGYHAGIGATEPGALEDAVAAIASPLRGFFCEGAAMALALRDALAPWRPSLALRFLDGAGARYAYLVHVGLGLAWARLRLDADRRRARLDPDPLLGWLALDGFGFHEGLFRRERTVLERRVPRFATPYASRAFDQGLGRSLWFTAGADAEAIAARIAAFPAARRADLYSGVGLAAAYAGPARDGELQALAGYAGPRAPDLAQGAAFAAKARQRAGNPSPDTELACRVLCRCTAAHAAALTDAGLLALPPGDSSVPAYELWRRRVRTLVAAVRR